MGVTGEYKMQGPGLSTKYKHTYRPITPKRLQTRALGILTQGQACELDVASYPEGFGQGLWQSKMMEEYPGAAGLSYGRGQSSHKGTQLCSLQMCLPPAP